MGRGDKALTDRGTSTINKWYSLSESKPDSGKDVEVKCSDGKQIVVYRCGFKNTWHDASTDKQEDIDVTEWRYT